MRVRVEIDKEGIIKDLPWQLRVLNALLWPLNPIVMAASAQWLCNTHSASKDGVFRWPHTVKGFNYLTGVSCADVEHQLWQFGIPTQSFRLVFALWPDRKGIGMEFSFWVPATQAAMADDILRQYEGHYAIDGPRIGRGAKFTKPWGVPASVRSFDQWVLTALHRFIGPQLKLETGKGKKVTQKLRKDKS